MSVFGFCLPPEDQEQLLLSFSIILDLLLFIGFHGTYANLNLGKPAAHLLLLGALDNFP